MQKAQWEDIVFIALLGGALGLVLIIDWRLAVAFAAGIVAILGYVLGHR